MPATLASSLTPADDAEILLQAEGIVRDFCGWVIAPPTVITCTIESRGGDLVLPSSFVTAVTSVSFEGAELTGWRLTEAGVLTGYCFPCGPVAVEFTHGYALDAIPPTVTRVVQSVAQRIKGRSSAGGLKTKQAGPFAESYGAELEDAEKADLGPYCQTLV